MTDVAAQAEMTATTPEQARLLLDFRYSALLRRLMTEEAGAAELARALGLPLGRVHHQLGRLVEAELAHITGQSARGGRPVKRYRAAARSFAVPYHLTDAATLTELLEGMYTPFFRRSTQQLATHAALRDVSTVMLTLDHEGQLEIRLGPQGRAPGVTRALWGEVRLSPARAQELHQRLGVLLEDFRRPDPAASESDITSYLIGVMLVPGELET